MPLRMLEYSQRNHSPVEAFCRSFIGRGESAPAVFQEYAQIARLHILRSRVCQHIENSMADCG